MAATAQLQQLSAKSPCVNGAARHTRDSDNNDRQWHGRTIAETVEIMSPAKKNCRRHIVFIGDDSVFQKQNVLNMNTNTCVCKLKYAVTGAYDEHERSPIDQVEVVQSQPPPAQTIWLILLAKLGHCVCVCAVAVAGGIVPSSSKSPPAEADGDTNVDHCSLAITSPEPVHHLPLKWALMLAHWLGMLHKNCIAS